MSEQSVIRVGVIGAGSNTRRKHIPFLQAIEGVEVVAVCNRSLASSRQVCDQLNIPRAEQDPDAVLTDPAIDAIVIGTWPYKHCEFTLKALAHGKHVLTEARMASNAREAELMLAAARAHPHLTTQIVPAPHSLSYDHLVRELVEQKLGRLIGVRATAHGGFPDDESPTKPWRRDERYSGYNVMGMGIQYEALMRWVGPVRSLFAETRVIVDQGHNAETGRIEPIIIPDHLIVVGTLEQDQASFEMSMSRVTGFDRTSQVWIYGTRGTILLGDGVHFGERGDPEMHKVDIESRRGPGWRVEEEFIGAIRRQEPIRRTTFEDGVRYMRFTEAVHQSARTGRRVEVVNDLSSLPTPP